MYLLQNTSNECKNITDVYQQDKVVQLSKLKCFYHFITFSHSQLQFGLNHYNCWDIISYLST